MDAEFRDLRSLHSTERQNELSRESLLKEVRLQRSVRERERQHLKATIHIQSRFRGWRVQKMVHRQESEAWLLRFSGIVQDLSSLPTAKVISEEVLPPMLFVHMRPGTSFSKRAAGGEVMIDPPSAKQAQALRGALALLLRSIASPDMELNYCALPISTGCRRAWLRQAGRVMVLCAAVQAPRPMAAASQDSALLQAAAARVLLVLTHCEYWKCWPPGDPKAAELAADVEQHALNSHSVAAAVRRLLLIPQPNQPPAKTSASAALPQMLQVLLRPLQLAGQPGPPHSLGVALVLAEAQLRASTAELLLQQPTSTHQAARSPSRQPEKGQEHWSILPAGAEMPMLGPTRPLPGAACAELAARYVMTVPRLDQQPTAVASQLATPTVLLPCMAALRHLAGARTHAATGACTCEHVTTASQPGTDLLDPIGCLAAVGNLSSLLAGARVHRVMQDGRTLEHVQPSQLLKVPHCAEQYIAAAMALMWRVLTDHGGACADDEGVAGSLWALCEGGFLSQVLGALAAQPDGGTPAFALCFHALLQAAAAGPQGGARATGLANGLALGCPSFLPQLWRWLAIRLGLPLEAPVEATRGWNIASLAHGCVGLPPACAATFGLFCRLYLQLLLVLDDEEFYECQAPLTLAQQRGITTTLNTLVFRMHCPAPHTSEPAGHSSRAANGLLPAHDAAGMLAQWAAPLLRALFERDARRPFCPPALWLAPFAETEGALGAKAQFAVAAVTRVLLQGATAHAAPEARGGPGGCPARLAALLQTAPQALPFALRVQVFRALVAADKERAGRLSEGLGLGARGGWGLDEGGAGPGALRVTIRRTHLLEDAYLALRNAGPGLKGPVSVKFVSSLGIEEAGLDHGGLLKELLEEVLRVAMDPRYGLFAAAPAGGALPRAGAAGLPDGLGLLHVVGGVLGKALYEGVLLEAPLALPVVARLQGRRPAFDDLAALDPALHRSLAALKRYEGDASELGLVFSVEEEVLGARRSFELRDGGDSIAVTNANRLQYIHLVSDWHLNRRLAASLGAFSAGVGEVVAPAWLRLFSAREFGELLGGGTGGGVDVADLAAHTQYSGGFSPRAAAVRTFWKVVAAMSAAERSALLKYTTSVGRAPLGGFSHLNPPFTLHRVQCKAGPLASITGHGDVGRLPTAATCFNMLKLPDYRHAATMRQKLLYVLAQHAGFDLS